MTQSRAEYMKQYRKNNRDKLNEYQKKYNKNNNSDNKSIDETDKKETFSQKKKYVFTAKRQAAFEKMRTARLKQLEEKNLSESSETDSDTEINGDRSDPEDIFEKDIDYKNINIDELQPVSTVHLQTVDLINEIKNLQVIFYIHYHQ